MYFTYSIVHNYTVQAGYSCISFNYYKNAAGASVVTVKL